MSNNLAVFAATADQRYLLGPELFLRTHYPMTFHRYGANGDADLISEDTLLHHLLRDPDKGRELLGNRVWILYGAPGSGKSEMVRWLQTRINQEDSQRAPVTIRISRNELDALSVVKRFVDLLPDSFLSETTVQRWQDARQKPRTISKMILLFALENMLDSDELINALFYRLLNDFHPYVNQILQVEDIGPVGVDIIGKEAWDAVVKETALDVPLDYEQFRHQLTIAFRDHLLEGISLTDTMQRISEHITEDRGTRPIMLVDDLVQSLNVFATDILDYLLTLEAGNWDVVLGLTPAAFEDSKRGRSLLQRIAYLDTIDDRVEKLWLSDESGHDSYTLTEMNCHEFARYYLSEYHDGNAISSDLYPFSRELLVRIYRGLPVGKGKVRYFVRALRDILKRTKQGENLLSVLDDFAQIEYVARVDDKQLARICEFYGPLVDSKDTREVNLSPEVLRPFYIDRDSLKINIEPMIKFHFQRESTIETADDEGKKAIRDWLLNKPVNRQLLKGLRQGAARWIRSIQPANWLVRDGIARPKGILRWQGAYLDTCPPICIEGVDDIDGILLTRDIGLLAFDLYRFASSKGDESKAIAAQLAQEPDLIPLQYSASRFRQRLFDQLTEHLDMSVESLALSLYVFLLLIDDSASVRPPGLHKDFWTEIVEKRAYRAPWKYQLRRGDLEAIQILFADFFQLRRNLYDGERIFELVGGRPTNPLLDWLVQVDTTAINKNYRLGRRPLSKVLTSLQETIRQWQELSDSNTSISQETGLVLQKLLSSTNGSIPLSAVPTQAWSELKSVRPEIYANLQVSLRNT